MTPAGPLVLPAAALHIRVVEENLYALFRAIRGLPGGELVEGDALSYHHALPPNPMFKGVWRTRLDPGEVDGAIEERLAWFRARGAPFFFWWLDSETRPGGLPERLRAHGFTSYTLDDPGMAADLHALREEDRTPAGFTVVRAADRKTLEDWRDVFCGVYETPPSMAQAWVDATLTLGLDGAPWRLYVGYLDGRPVATNLSFGGGGVVGLYMVGTLPEARGRGVGAAITLQPLVEARAEGYRTGVLFASHMGYPVYQRLGFREVEGRIGRFIWRDPGGR